MTSVTYTIRTACPDDEPAICELLETIIREFRDKDITMWQNGYPARADINRDVASGNSYVAVRDCYVVGFMYIHFGPEAFHSTLKGEWRDSDCTVMHRLLTDPSTRGTGLGAQMMSFWEDVTRRHGCKSMRTETDATNVPMRRLMSRCGFTENGVLRFDNSDKIGFEKLI